MLIVEGTDMIGKTELCKVLVERLNAKGYPVTLQHFGLLPNNWDFYWDYLGYVNRTTVMDRFVMSEVVYGNVLRGGARMSPETYRRLDAYMALNASVTVVVVADEKWFACWLDARYDVTREKFTQKQILDVNVGFRAIIDPSSVGYLHWSRRFKCDYDIVYTVNDNIEMPSSNENFVQSIVDLYCRRLDDLERVEQDAIHNPMS